MRHKVPWPMSVRETALRSCNGLERIHVETHRKLRRQHVRVMVGGHRIYEERLYPDLQKDLLAQGMKGTYYRDVYLDYTQNWREHGFAVSLGAGVDIGINRALGLRLASVDYLHSWLSELNGSDFRNGLRLSTGLIVNMGSW